MSGSSEVPAIPEDVRKIASDAATECMPFETVAWYNVRREIEQAILADRLARPVDTGREKALEEAADLAEREIRRAWTRWIGSVDGAQLTVRLCLKSAHEMQNVPAAIRALANPENGRG